MENKNELEIGEYVLLADGEIVKVIDIGEWYNQEKNKNELVYYCIGITRCDGDGMICLYEDLIKNPEIMGTNFEYNILSHNKNIEDLDTFTYRGLIHRTRVKQAIKYFFKSLKRKICFWKK